jgi:predicted RNA-binding Zn ribbon-like protein
MEAAGLLGDETAAGLRRRLGSDALDAAAAESRDLREWVRAWIARRRAAPRASYRRELRELNALLERARWRREAVAGPQGVRIVDRCPIESARDLPALLAGEIAAFVSREDPALVKQCAASDCSLWFVDRTKAHRRIFCSATACGNRAKVAAFRQRQREA